MSMIRVIKKGRVIATYSNVSGNSNIDGTLRLQGRDEDGPWAATFPPGDWSEIEEVPRGEDC
jgi:hypothetical protein